MGGSPFTRLIVSFVAAAVCNSPTRAGPPVGEIVAWGGNGFGQLNVPAGENFVAVSAGIAHGLALRSNGSLAAWGLNSHGQTTVPAGNDFIAIDAGGFHCVALRSDGSLAGWGNNSRGQASVPAGTNFAAIAAGGQFTLVIRTDGSLAAWGSNDFGALNVPAGQNFVAIAAGSEHGLAIRTDGTLAAWGLNVSGQTNAPTGNDYMAVSAGANFSLALRTNGTIAGWGVLPVRQGGSIPPGTNFAAISASQDHTLTLLTDGSLFPFGGSNFGGVLNAPAGTDFVAISASLGGGLASEAFNLAIRIPEPDFDGDNDGFDDVNQGGDDCDDNNPNVHPGAVESDNGIDDDCDGDVDEGFDGDEDGFTPIAGGDCDDSDAGVYPGAAETPDDGIDQDCNGFDAVTCYVDADMDQFGSSATTLSDDGDCTDAGEADNDDDCDDTNGSRFPGNSEIPYDGIDQDCDEADLTDVDTDGFDAVAAGGNDCDDNDPAIFPGAAETPDDGIDQDCNGFGTITCFVEVDTDGFGLNSTTLSIDGDCDDAGESANDADCDDGDPAIHPDAAETCDGVDNNCSGVIDEGFPDADTDGLADCIDDDRDGDGTPNDSDGCPDDPEKTEPGTAGCGNSEPDPTPVDNDGVDGATEDGAPNGGDGNNDGVPDSQQNNVTSLPNVNGDYLTIVSPAGTELLDVLSGANPSPDTAPPGVEFPAGFVSFNVGGVAPGAGVEVQIIAHLPPGMSVETYWKFGPSPDDVSPHWYEFLFDGVTGGQIAGNVITLQFVDGQRGDADLAANGVVAEPGGLASASTPAGGTNPPSGQPAGCCAPGAYLPVSLIAPMLWIGRRRGRVSRGSLR